jgi:hypothetical protein
MDLFHWLATETAERLDFSYPREGDERATEWVGACLSQMDGSSCSKGAFE